MLTLILGGARGGKSALAERLALDAGGSVLYVATAEAIDDEMCACIAAHRAQRPPFWRTCEEPRAVAAALARAWPEAAPDFVLLDCVTVWINNLLFAQGENPDAAAAARVVEQEVAALLAFIAGHPARWVLVSNEVGLGIVPDTPLTRLYRDLLGRVNQQLAAAADKVIMVVAGLPVTIKGKDE